MMPGDTRSECAVIKQGMVQGGVPAELILEEHRATNTAENVLFGLPVIDAAVGLKNIKSVIYLGKVCGTAGRTLAHRSRVPGARVVGMAEDRALQGARLHRRLAVGF